MRKTISLVLLLIPLITIAQQDAERIDISSDVKKRLINIISDPNNDISHYSLVRSYKKASIVYTTKDSINVVNMFQGRNFEFVQSPLIAAENMDKSLRGVRLPLRRESAILLSSDSGKFTYAISNSYGEQWSSFKSCNYTTTSSIIYIHQNKMANNQLIAYFIGSGNLTPSDLTQKSMVFMIVSKDGGKLWSEPEIALKHNLYSLNNATIALYSGRKNKENELYMICTSNDNKSIFISTSSNDGLKWSYPTEMPYLNNTGNHILSIYKKRASIVFTDLNNENKDDYGDVSLAITSIKDIKKYKSKVEIYKLYDYSQKEITEMKNKHTLNHTLGAILLLPRRLLFTISTHLKPDVPSAIKYIVIDVGKYKSKVL